jgi:hypothetical protein
MGSKGDCLEVGRVFLVGLYARTFFFYRAACYKVKKVKPTAKSVEPDTADDVDISMSTVTDEGAVITV